MLSFEHVINISRVWRCFTFSFSYYIFKIWCICYTSNTSQLRLDPFLVSESHQLQGPRTGGRSSALPAAVRRAAGDSSEPVAPPPASGCSGSFPRGPVRVTGGNCLGASITQGAPDGPFSDHHGLSRARHPAVTNLEESKTDSFGLKRNQVCGKEEFLVWGRQQPVDRERLGSGESNGKQRLVFLDFISSI